jgi:hypothetical protein
VAKARKRSKRETEYLDVIAAFLACFHYNAQTGCYEVEVIKEGTRATLNNFAMLPVAPRLSKAIVDGCETLGRAAQGKPLQEWWQSARELEGG